MRATSRSLTFSLCSVRCSRRRPSPATRCSSCAAWCARRVKISALRLRFLVVCRRQCRIDRQEHGRVDLGSSWRGARIVSPSRLLDVRVGFFRLGSVRPNARRSHTGIRLLRTDGARHQHDRELGVYSSRLVSLVLSSLCRRSVRRPAASRRFVHCGSSATCVSKLLLVVLVVNLTP